MARHVLAGGLLDLRQVLHALPAPVDQHCNKGLGAAFGQCAHEAHDLKATSFIQSTHHAEVDETYAIVTHRPQIARVRVAMEQPVLKQHFDKCLCPAPGQQAGIKPLFNQCIPLQRGKAR